jgi:hypothetical protein
MQAFFLAISMFAKAGAVIKADTAAMATINFMRTPDKLNITDD